jgi:GNAT superfamily N-acetyltransferase
MTQLIQKNKLIRKERKLVNRLWSISFYKSFIFSINFIFSPVKIFLVISWKWLKKVWWIISVSTYKIFSKKIWYIDDFIVHKKTRWQWLWKKLINSALEKSSDHEHDYLTLVSKSDRKTSHHIYKKIGFTVVSFWVFMFAYKKMKNKK